MNDIANIRTNEGCVYKDVVMDLQSRLVDE
jgi:hypothetical protein